MVQRRVWCALALLTVAACSFPDYRVSEPPAGSSCEDGARSGDETGVDCGGATCEPCPSCDDGAQNGDESDVDCGGTCGERCETDQRCRENADCSSLVCNGVCQPSTCQDGVRNGAETSVDCGGGCAPCANGSACKTADDCVDKRCQEQVCVAAGCTDGVSNGQETDEDCGGPECGPCADGRRCAAPDDCESLVCAKAQCQPATCSDAVKNQGESDVDCGGASCAPCESGRACTQASDCETELCRNGTCVPTQASGEALSSARWTVRSSETATESETKSAFDGDDATAWTSGKDQYGGMYLELDLGKTEIFFRALLKVTSAPFGDDFPGRIDVYVSNDGSFGTPTLTGVQGNQYTWCLFSGAQVGRYLRFVVTQPKAGVDWSVGEIQVLN